VGLLGYVYLLAGYSSGPYPVEL
jgi:hypothetical protein